MSKPSKARLITRGERFEIVIDPERALDYKLGKPVPLSRIVLVDTIFTDIAKGMRASREKLLQHFRTDDTMKVAEVILRQGEVLLTAQQRRRLIEDKRRQIVSILCRYTVDPRTNLPHPPLRIEQALARCHFPIDPFRDAEEQARRAAEALKPILPIKMEIVKMEVLVRPEFASRTYGVVRDYATIVSEEWQTDGSWKAVVEVPAGIRASFLEKLSRVTQGSVLTKILE